MRSVGGRAQCEGVQQRGRKQRRGRTLVNCSSCTVVCAQRSLCCCWRLMSCRSSCCRLLCLSCIRRMVSACTVCDGLARRAGGWRACGRSQIGAIIIQRSEEKGNKALIYYSNSYDLEIRLQSEDRAHRIGQTKAVTYIDLVSPDTIDEKVLDALRSKVSLAGKVLGEEVKGWLS